MADRDLDGLGADVRGRGQDRSKRQAGGEIGEGGERVVVCDSSRIDTLLAIRLPLIATGGADAKFAAYGPCSPPVESQPVSRIPSPVSR